MKTYQKRYQEIQEMFDILRVQPAIMKITTDALNNQLDPKRYPFLGDEQQKAESIRGPAKWHKEKESDEARIILGVIGGISHNEICCLQNIDRQAGS